MPTNGDHQVIQFRPRSSLRPAAGWERSTAQLANRQVASEPDDLKRYESNPDEPDDYRHRMIANAAAAVFAVALTAIGLWLAVTIADLRKTQDCVLYGYRNCGGFPQPQSLPARQGG